MGGFHILQIEDVLHRVHGAVKNLNRVKDNYTEIVFQLRSIRKAQKLSQKEMAERLGVSQSKVSRFESFNLTIKLDFLISYAEVLGFSVAICKTDDMTTPLPLSMARESDISAKGRARQLVSTLLECQMNIDPMTDTVITEVLPLFMSEVYGVPERNVRRLQTDSNYMPAASLVFRYAFHVGMALRLSEDLQTSKNAKVSNLGMEKYSEFVFVLRSIRESYQIKQGEMAALMKVNPSTISKFESENIEVTLDFLIFYAALLGYNIKVGSVIRSWGEFPRFRRRQSRIAKALRYIEQHHVEGTFRLGLHWHTVWPGAFIGESKNRIISELRSAKKTEGLTTKKLSEQLGVSDRTIRRFERERNYAPSASLIFNYVTLVNTELRLEKNLRRKRETLDAFFVRRCFVLYHWLRYPPV